MAIYQKIAVPFFYENRKAWVQTRHHERPRSCRSEHSNPGGAIDRFSTSSSPSGIRRLLRPLRRLEGPLRALPPPEPHGPDFPRASNPQKKFRDGSFFRIRKIIEICTCLNLEVLSVPEDLVHSIGILEAPAVVLARRWCRC